MYILCIYNQRRGEHDLGLLASLGQLRILGIQVDSQSWAKNTSRYEVVRTKA